jgi:hypothetical protein
MCPLKQRRCWVLEVQEFLVVVCTPQLHVLPGQAKVLKVLHREGLAADGAEPGDEDEGEDDRDADGDEDLDESDGAAMSVSVIARHAGAPLSEPRVH